MTEKLKNIINTELEKLPKEIKDSIEAIDWVSLAEEIGKKHLLNESQINDFQVQILLVFIGLKDAEFFEINLENYLETTKKQAEEISDETFDKIFDPIGGVLEEKLKNSIKNKEMTWKQSVDFILSGGDYSTLLETQNNRVSLEPEKVSQVLGTKSMQDMKDRLVN